MLAVQHGTANAGKPVKPLLFRPEVSAARRPSSLGQVLLVNPLSFRVFTLFALLCASLMLAFLFWGSYTQRTVVSGVLLPTTGLIKIVSPQNALIVERRVQEGQTVPAGAVLYVLSQELALASGRVSKESSVLHNLAARRASLQQEAQLHTQLSLQHQAQTRQQIASVQAEIQQLEQESNTQQQKADSLAQQTQKQQQLASQGYVTNLALQQKQDELLEQQARLQGMQRNRLNLQRERSRLEAELANGEQQARQEQQQLNRQTLELEQASTQSQYQFVLTAPQAGTLTSVIAEAGLYTGNNQTLASLVPTAAVLEAQAFVPSRAAGFIKPGQTVRLRYTAYPYQKFGQYPGVIQQVAKTPVSNAELPSQFATAKENNESWVRVRIRLASQDVQLYGQAEKLSAGMQFEADILQDRRSLWEWLLEPLFSLRGMLHA